MNSFTIRNASIAVVCCVMILLIFSGCDSKQKFEREYYDDIYISLQDSSEKIIIKEWSFLLGSGFEVYYQKDDNTILLGEAVGGDDGFCPFKMGMYELIQEGNSVTVKWCFNLANDDRNNWKSETFELPW